MGEKTQQKIAEALKQGYSQYQISESFRNKLTTKGVPAQEIDAFLSEHSLPVSQDQPMSALTGKPEIPAQEQISMGRSVAAKSMPIAGDIAGTMVGGPVAGMIKGPRLLAPLIRSLFAGAGAFGGSAAQQKMEGRPFDPKEAAIQGGVGMGVEGLGAALKPAVRPTLDFLSDLTYSGRKLKDVWRDKIIRQTTEAAENFTGSKLLPRFSKEESGMKIGDVLSSSRDFKTVYKQYNEALSGIDHRISLDDADGIIGQLYGDMQEKFGNASDSVLTSKVVSLFGIKDQKTKTILREFIEGAERGTMPPDDAAYFLATINKNYKGKTSAQREITQKLKDAVVKDLQYIKSMDGKTADILKENADAIFREATEWFKNNPQAFRVVDNMRTQQGLYYEAMPDKALDIIFNADPKELARIRDRVTKAAGGKEAWASGVYNHVRDLYQNAMKFDDATGAAQVLPAKLADTLEARLPAIRVMDADVAKNLEKEIKFYREVAPEFAKRQKSHASQYVGGALSQVVGGPGPIGLAVTEGFGAGAALAVMSPKIRNVLSGIVKQGTKAAGHLAVPPMMPAH